MPLFLVLPFHKTNLTFAFIPKNLYLCGEMIRKHRHIIISFLIANLLFSNIGLSVNWMYCFCKGQMQVSLFSLDENCKKEDTDTANCCEVERCDKNETLKPCCKKFQKFHKGEKPCTQKGKKYFKADLKFFLAEKEIKKTQLIDYQEVDINIFFQNIPSFLSEKKTSSLLNKAPPPRLYGRELIIFVQNFRC